MSSAAMGTATSCDATPRKPPAETMAADSEPSGAITRSRTVPIFAFWSLYTDLPRMLFFTLQPLSSAFDCSTVTLSGCVPATCACAPRLVAATATTTTNLPNVISFTPLLVDLTGAWRAPKGIAAPRSYRLRGTAASSVQEGRTRAPHRACTATLGDGVTARGAWR